MRPLLGDDDWTVAGKRELDAIQEVLDNRERLRVEEKAETVFEVAAAAGEGTNEGVIAKASAEEPAPAGAVAADSPSAASDASNLVNGNALLATPPGRRANPEPPGSRAPLGPANPLKIPIPAAISGQDLLTPTPGGDVGSENGLPARV